MADITHASLTGADLHEPKGVAAASDNDIAQASGGAVSWSSEITPSKITLSDTVWDDIRVSLISTNTGSANAPDFTKFTDNGSSSGGVYLYLFDASTEEEVWFDVQIPHKYKAGSNLRPHVHWAPTSTNTGNVVWGLEYVAHSEGDTIGNSTIITVTDAGDGTAKKHQIVNFPEIDGTNLEESSIINCRFFRKAADAGDTYTGDAAVLSIDFHFEIEKMGTDDEYPGA